VKENVLYFPTANLLYEASMDMEQEQFQEAVPVLQQVLEREP